VRIRFAVAVALAVVFAGTIGMAQGRGRVEKYVVGPLDIVAVADPADPAYAPLGRCDGFDILEDFGFVGTFMDRYDQSGKLVQRIAKFDYPYDRYYNSKNAAKEVYAVPGEHQSNQFVAPVFDAAGNYIGGVHHGSGPSAMITVPGYGNIFAETGTFSFDMTTWTMTYNRGHNQFFAADLAALCDYLK